MSLIKKLQKKWEIITLQRKIKKYLTQNDNSESLFLFCYCGPESKEDEFNSLQDFADGLFENLGIILTKSNVKVCRLTVQNSGKEMPETYFAYPCFNGLVASKAGDRIFRFFDLQKYQYREVKRFEIYGQSLFGNIPRLNGKKENRQERLNIECTLEYGELVPQRIVRRYTAAPFKPVVVWSRQKYCNLDTARKEVKKISWELEHGYSYTETPY